MQEPQNIKAYNAILHAGVPEGTKGAGIFGPDLRSAADSYVGSNPTSRMSKSAKRL